VLFLEDAAVADDDEWLVDPLEDGEEVAGVDAHDDTGGLDGVRDRGGVCGSCVHGTSAAKCCGLRADTNLPGLAGWIDEPAEEAAHPHVRFTSNRDVAIEVVDLAPAEAFYAGTLGFHVRSRGEQHLEIDTGAFTLWVNCTGGPRRSFIPSLDVPDAAPARAMLEAAGCRIVRESAEGRGFYFEDPFGFVVDVVERREGIGTRD
jgi:hypothetical protein